MEYILNKLPVKTTNNFKVNDLKVNLDIPDITDMRKFTIVNNDYLEITQEIVDNTLTFNVLEAYSISIMSDSLTLVEGLANLPLT